MADTHQLDDMRTETRRLGWIAVARLHSIGDAFTAPHCSAEIFAGNMDPLLMGDDFVMSAPTFAPHR